MKVLLACSTQSPNPMLTVSSLLAVALLVVPASSARQSRGASPPFSVDGAGNLTAATLSGDGSAVTGVDAETLDGFAATSFFRKYVGVAIVARAPIAEVGEVGYYNDPGAALNAVARWCGTPSAVNTCLIKVLPGVYPLPSSNLTMQEFVDIEGSGRNVTRMVDSDAAAALVVGAANAEIRSLTLEHDGNEGSPLVIGIESFNGASPSVVDVDIVVSDPDDRALGVFSVSGSAPAYLRNVTITEKAMWDSSTTEQVSPAGSTGGRSQSPGTRGSWSARA